MQFKVIALVLILLPMLTGLLSWVLSRKLSDRACNILAGAETLFGLGLSLLLLGHIGEGFDIAEVCGFQIGFQVTGLQTLLCLLASILWAGTTLFVPYYFSGHEGQGRYQLFSLLTLGAILGVFLAADFFTALVFFEVMSFTSWVLVIHERTADAVDAAASYLGFAVIGGLGTLMGLFLLYNMAGTVRFDDLASALESYKGTTQLYVAGAFTLVGFAAKAGVFPLHTWLPAAHPAAPATASALLSGIITKAGVFGIFSISAKLFLHDAPWGMAMLCFGVITMFTGAFLAIFSTDIKRTLACSSMSQIGFIVVGVGMQGLLAEHNTLAVWGSVLHVVNHSTLKLCLFLCAGVLVHCCHTRELNELRGFGRGKPLFTFAFLSASLGLMCIPGFGGYISKTLLHESIVEYIALLSEHGSSVGFFKAVEVVFLISGGLTVAYMTKLCVALFVDKRPAQAHDGDGGYITKGAGIVLLLSGLIPPVLGMLPRVTMDRIAGFAAHYFFAHELEHTIAYYSLVNLKGAAISLSIGAAVYFGVIRTCFMQNGEYVDRWPKAINLEKKLYRPLLMKWLPFVCAIFARILASLFEWLRQLCESLLMRGNSHIAENDQDENFAAYPKDMESSRGFAATLTYGLALTGLVLVLCMSFVIYKTCVA